MISYHQTKYTEWYAQASREGLLHPIPIIAFQKTHFAFRNELSRMQWEVQEAIVGVLETNAQEKGWRWETRKER